MKKFLHLIIPFFLLLMTNFSWAEEGFIPRFSLEVEDIQLERLAQPQTYFDKVGRRFAILGYESGCFEAWAYPLKIVRNFEFSFFIGSSTKPIRGADIVRYISVNPAHTTLTYTFQSFTVKAIYITPIEEPGAIILLEVDTTEPLTVVCSFIPVLEPMWPAGIGGQYTSWDKTLRAYLISEPTRKNHGYVGAPAAEGISYTPAHMLSDVPNELRIAIQNGRAAKGKFIPFILAGGKGNREDIKQVYMRLASNPEQLYRATLEHYRNLRQNTLIIETPEKNLNLAFEWAKVSYDNLIVENPDLGKGMVAGLGPSGMGGRPGFGWFFGGDAYINSLSLNSFGASRASKDILAFTQKWQREDGKMAHELSQAAGYINWFRDYPYGYIHGDTTPYYIAAIYDYYRMSGDGEFVKRSWPSLKKAYDWCLSTDEDGDGLMDNKKAGLGALEFGALTGIQTDIYLAGVWTRATYAMQHLAAVAGKMSYAKKAREDYRRALAALDSKFWDEETGVYSYAFTADGKRVKEITPWCAVALMWNFGDPERSARSLERISRADLTTDWGVRMLSSQSSLFEPLNYNYGAVWPFLTSWVASAQYKHNFSLQGYHSLLSTVLHVFDNALGHVTEVFSGYEHIWPQEAVPHQGFCTAGVVLPLVRGLLGLEGDAPEKRIIFEPRFPAHWDEVSIRNYRIGDEKFSFRYKREETKIRIEVDCKNQSLYTMLFAPVFAPGTGIHSITLNGKRLPFQVLQSSQAVQASCEFVLSASDRIEVNFEPAVELVPMEVKSDIGDLNQGLKIISAKLHQEQLRVIVEGISMKSYTLRVVNSKLIESAIGAELKGDQLLIQIPQGEGGEFMSHEVLLNLKQE